MAQTHNMNSWAGRGKKYHKNSQLTKSIEFQISSTRLPWFKFIKCINMQLIRQNDLKLVWGHLRNVNLLHLMGFLWSIWILLIFTEISNFSAVHLRQHEAQRTYQSKFARFLAQCWFASTKLIISISRIIFLRIFFLVDFSILCSVKKNFSLNFFSLYEVALFFLNCWFSLFLKLNNTRPLFSLFSWVRYLELVGCKFNLWSTELKRLITSAVSLTFHFYHLWLLRWVGCLFWFAEFYLEFYLDKQEFYWKSFDTFSTLTYITYVSK